MNITYTPNPHNRRINSATQIADAIALTGMPAGPLAREITLYRAERGGRVLHNYSFCGNRTVLKAVKIAPINVKGKLCSKCRPNGYDYGDQATWFTAVQSAYVVRKELDEIRLFHGGDTPRRASASVTAAWLRATGSNSFASLISALRVSIQSAVNIDAEVTQAALELSEDLEREGRELAQHLDQIVHLPGEVQTNHLADELVIRRMRRWSTQSDQRNRYGGDACSAIFRAVESWRTHREGSLHSYLERTIREARTPHLAREIYPEPWFTTAQGTTPWEWLNAEWQARLSELAKEATVEVEALQRTLDQEATEQVVLVIGTTSAPASGQITGSGVADVLLSLGAQRSTDSSLWVTHTDRLTAHWVQERLATTSVRTAVVEDLDAEVIATALALWPTLPPKQRYDVSEALRLSEALAA